MQDWGVPGHGLQNLAYDVSKFTVADKKKGL